MDFRVIGEFREVETIAEGTGIRKLRQLMRSYGDGNWRKRKGVAQIETATGEMGLAELHWYECHGRGKFEIKFKRYIYE